MSSVENASDAGEVVRNKPEAQAKGIDFYVLINALRLRFRLVSPEAGSSIERCRIHSTLRTRRLVAPSPPHPSPLPRGEREPEVPSAQRVIADSTVLKLRGT